MAVSTFNELKDHIGHHVEVNTYVDKEHDNAIVNIAIECMDCNCVLMDFDNDTEENIILEPAGDEDPEFGRDEWSQDARDGDTELGYWDWVEHRREFYKANPQYKHYVYNGEFGLF
jgi:hypothetical protein